MTPEGLRAWLLRVSCLLADFCNVIACAVIIISSSYKEKTENNASHCFVVMLCELYPQFGSIVHTSLQQNKAMLLIIKVLSIAHIFFKKYNYIITKDFRKKLLLKIRRKSRIKKVKLKQVSSNWSFHLCFQLKKKIIYCFWKFQIWHFNWSFLLKATTFKVTVDSADLCPGYRKISWFAYC